MDRWSLEFTIPADAHDADRRRIEDAIAVSRRNYQIRQRYQLLRKHGTSQIDAITKLAHERELSESAIERAIWPRRIR